MPRVCLGENRICFQLLLYARDFVETAVGESMRILIMLCVGMTVTLLICKFYFRRKSAAVKTRLGARFWIAEGYFILV